MIGGLGLSCIQETERCSYGGRFGGESGHFRWNLKWELGLGLEIAKKSQ